MGAAVTAGRRRLERLTGGPVAPVRPAGRSPVVRLAVALAAVVAAYVGIGGVIGIALGLGAGAGVVLTGRASSQPQRAAPDDVPAVVELIAGCLAAGLPMPAALDAASIAGDHVTREACLAASAALRRGAPATEAWQSWRSDPSLEPVARATVRTTQSGASVADDLRRVAARMRARRHSRLQQRVQQASVWVVVPLGLFFLPAFVLVAVVPVVIGLFQHAR
jgi:Flp pilus assembly protein TadB